MHIDIVHLRHTLLTSTVHFSYEYYFIVMMNEFRSSNFVCMIKKNNKEDRSKLIVK